MILLWQKSVQTKIIWILFISINCIVRFVYYQALIQVGFNSQYVLTKWHNNFPSSILWANTDEWWMLHSSYFGSQFDTNYHNILVQVISMWRMFLSKHRGFSIFPSTYSLWQVSSTRFSQFILERMVGGQEHYKTFIYRLQIDCKKPKQI